MTRNFIPCEDRIKLAQKYLKCIEFGKDPFYVEEWKKWISDFP